MPQNKQTTEDDTIVTTRAQFYAMREGLAGAHLLLQRILPELKQRRAAFDKDTRQLIQIVPEPLRTGFSVASQISAEQNAMPTANVQSTPTQSPALDTRTLRTELENVSALTLPDLEYEMQCALEELPMFREQCVQRQLAPPDLAAITAWAWEAGRRYGLIEALAVLDATSLEFIEGTRQVLEQARDRSLDLVMQLTTDPNIQPARDEIKAFEYLEDDSTQKPGPKRVQ